MELFVWILVPAICALIGYSLMLYRSFACLVASGFAAYLGVWSEKLLFPFFEFLPSTQASSAGAMIAGAVIVFGVFAAIYTALNFDQNSYVFPLLIDSFGGALSGFFTGLIIIGFVGLTFCLATFNTDLSSKFPSETVQERSIANIMTLTEGINFITLQTDRNQACQERLDQLFPADDAASSPETFTKDRKMNQ